MGCFVLFWGVVALLSFSPPLCYYGLLCIELEVKNESICSKAETRWIVEQVKRCENFSDVCIWKIAFLIQTVEASTGTFMQLEKKYFILVLFNSNWIKSVNTYFLRWRNLTPFLGWTSGSPPCFSVSRKPYRMRRVTFADLPLLLFFKVLKKWLASLFFCLEPLTSI